MCGWRSVCKKCLEMIGLLDLVRWGIEEIPLTWRVICCRRNYRRQLERIRSKPRNEKIRVLFIVSEIAKWKEQKVYEALAASENFEPIVGISAWNNQSEERCPNDKLEGVLEKAEEFFDRLGDVHVRTVRIVAGRRVISDLSEFKPDVVYYTEPWGASIGQDPESVSKLALTFYTSYFVPDYEYIEEECHLPLHVFLFGYFCMGEMAKKDFERSYRLRNHTVRFIATGHPALDFFGKVSFEQLSQGGSVIYAPHFSFPHPKHGYLLQFHSTFDWNGREILDYAKRHPEFHWVFKPHPLLHMELVRTGVMTEAEANSYYEEWSRVGRVCQDGDYQGLFLESRALITDCGSFLTEYGATGKPVIHLICAQNTLQPNKQVKNLFNTYYKVRDLDEMRRTFQMVLENGQDPNRERRVAEVEQSGIAGGHASENIVAYLKELIGR